MAKRSIVARNEMYVPEARARGLEKQKKRNHLGTKIFLIGGLVLGLGVMFAPDIKDGIEFRVARREVVEQYGDTNGDGFVSPVEKQELFNRIFAKEDIRFDFNDSTAKDYFGRRVPISTLTKIMNEYLGK